MMLKRLGFFTRVLDDAAPAERYRLAAAQVVHAERCGFDSAWVAQHHFDGSEGGLPAPLVFLSHVAAQTSRIRLGTGIVTLPLENPVRVAEDASVLDLISGGRLEFGVGPGGTFTAFRAFDLDAADRGALTERNLAFLREAWAGGPLPGGNRLYPTNASLGARIWQASFGVEGARRAGLAGDGLLLSRTQPRPEDAPGLSLDAIQGPMIDAYLEALPEGVEPRILASRTVFVADDAVSARRLALSGLGRARDRIIAMGRTPPAASAEAMIAAQDVHAGTPEAVIASLQADRTLGRATDLAVQVHSVDPPHDAILRSIELVAGVVAPALGLAAGPMEGRRAA